MKRSRRLLSLPVAALIAFCSLTGAGAAQEVQWFHSYQKARVLAEKLNRPILIDIGSLNCRYCVKLDKTTFRDPAVVTMINRHFVPLKIRADQSPALVQALRIQGFPTLVYASPEGRILRYQRGYIDAARFKAQVKSTMATLASFDQQYYQTASLAIARGNYPTAISNLQKILKKGNSSPLQKKAQQLLVQLEKQAADRLVQARAYRQNGKAQEAQAVYQEVMHKYPGTQAASDSVLELSHYRSDRK